jgi:hypothetical protein
MANYFAGEVVNSPATIVNASQGHVSYSWGDTDLNTPGVFAVEWVVTWSGGAAQTFPQSSDYNFITVLNDLAIGYPDVTTVFNTIITGTAAPISSQGNNGDFFYNTTNSYFYGPKVAGVWPSGFLLNPAGLSLSAFSAPTGALSMGNQKITNMANGSALTDGAAYGQIPKVGIDVTQAPYFVDSTGSIDCTTAVNSAITALGSTGGTLLFPGGTYLFTGSASVNLSSSTNIRFIGTGGYSTSGAAGTTFSYSGTSSSSFINANGAFGAYFEGIAITNTSSSYSGILLDLGSTTSSTSCTVRGCYFLGTGASVTAVNIANSLTVSVDNCYFLSGQYGVVGSASATEAHIEDTYFKNLTVGVRNPGNSWMVNNCSFYGTGIQSTVAVAALTVLSSSFTNGTYGYSGFGNNLTFDGNYFTGQSVECINITAASMGLVVSNNNFNSAPTGIITVDTVGAAIQNNYFSSCTTATNYNTSTANLLTNGSYQAGTTGWSVVTGAALSQYIGDSYGGDQECMNVTTGGSTVGGFANTTAVTGVASNTYVQASVWVKLISGPASVQLTIKDTANSVTGTSATTASTSWTKLTAQVQTGSSAPSLTFTVATTGSTTATTFRADLATLRVGTAQVTSQFGLSYQYNHYNTVVTNITGTYNTGASVIEDPVGTVTQYGTVSSGNIAQASGYDTILGQDLYLPRNLALGTVTNGPQNGGGTGVLGLYNASVAPSSAQSSAAVIYAAGGRLKWLGSDGLAYQTGQLVLATPSTVPLSTSAYTNIRTASVGIGTYYVQASIGLTAASASTNTFKFTVSTGSPSPISFNFAAASSTSSVGATASALAPASFITPTVNTTNGCFVEIQGYITFAVACTFALAAESTTNASTVTTGSTLVLTPVA